MSFTKVDANYLNNLINQHKPGQSFRFNLYGYDIDSIRLESDDTLKIRIVNISNTNKPNENILFNCVILNLIRKNGTVEDFRKLFLKLRHDYLQSLLSHQHGCEFSYKYGNFTICGEYLTDQYYVKCVEYNGVTYKTSVNISYTCTEDTDHSIYLTINKKDYQITNKEPTDPEFSMLEAFEDWLSDSDNLSKFDTEQVCVEKCEKEPICREKKLKYLNLLKKHTGDTFHVLELMEESEKTIKSIESQIQQLSEQKDKAQKEYDDYKKLYECDEKDRQTALELIDLIEKM